MADLLLHSMSEFAEIIAGVLERAGCRDVVEIGAEYGSMTEFLLEYVEVREGSLISIDPAPSAEALALAAEHPRWRLIRTTSLESIPNLDADAWLIDGDHNYHTVSRESDLIWRRSRESGRPFLAFYHDVCWPWARRDLYYDPASIPADALHPYAWGRGVVPGVTGVVRGGFRGEGQWAAALKEGGERNGVLTAIEDFVVGKEPDLVWAMIPAVFGLGVLFERTAPWTEEVSAFLSPFHMNPLLRRMEENRLLCYLRVIEWQDRAAGEAAAHPPAQPNDGPAA